MPNYCENDLYIVGTPEDVAAVLALVGADQDPPQFDFNAVLPYPDEFRVRDEERKVRRTQEDREAFVAKYGSLDDGYNSGGYEWCMANWGTKWSASGVVRRDYGSVCVSFETAWTPPEALIRKLAERFPRVEFRLEYFEQGTGICGGFCCNESDSTPSEPGAMTCFWKTREYRGHRGG